MYTFLQNKFLNILTIIIILLFNIFVTINLLFAKNNNSVINTFKYFDSIDLDELLEPTVHLKSKKDQELALTQYHLLLKQKQINNCKALINKYQPIYKRLFSKLSPKEQSLLITEYAAFLNATINDCDIKNKFINVMKVIKHLILYSYPNVVFYLPFNIYNNKNLTPRLENNNDSSLNVSISDLIKSSISLSDTNLSFQYYEGSEFRDSQHFININILEGIKAYFKEQTYPYKSVHLHYQEQQIEPELILARCIFIYKASILITSISDPDSINVLSQWAKVLHLPIIFLSHVSQNILISNNPYVINLYPNPQIIVQAFYHYLKVKNYNKVAILIPSNKKNDNLFNILVNFLGMNNIQIIHNINYEPHNYESMKLAAQELFQLNYDLRKEEYLELIEQKSREAQETGKPFNPKFVELEPIVDFDVLFIMDNFVSVKKWIKIFKYFNVPPIPLIGTYEWRSRELVEPYDPFLANSVFVDFIGLYKDIPSVLKKSLVIKNDDMFLDIDIMQKLDYQIIGYYAAKLIYPLLKLKSKPNIKRILLPIYLKNQKLFNSSFFTVSSDFTDNGRVNWPIYFFKPIANSLILLKNFQ